MKYVINLTRYVGTNLIDTLFYGSYDSKEEYQKHLSILYETFVALGKYKECFKNNGDDFEKAYIVIE